MRSIRRLLTATAVSVAIAAGTIAAVPAAAGPEDGEGCVGLPSVPAAYVCVISLTPGNAVPNVTTTTIPVTVPEVCYFLDCAGPTTVPVPIPGASANENAIAVIYYNGQYVPIGLGTVGTLLPIVNGAVTLAVDTALGAVETAGEVLANLEDRVQPYVDLLNREIDVVIGLVTDLVQDPPTVDDVIAALERNAYYRLVMQKLQGVLDQICWECIST
jgi:hypothetical protein